MSDNKGGQLLNVLKQGAGALASFWKSLTPEQQTLLLQQAFKIDPDQAVKIIRAYQGGMSDEQLFQTLSQLQQQQQRPSNQTIYIFLAIGVLVFVSIIVVFVSMRK